MDITSESYSQGTVIKLVGEIDLASSPQARKIILAALKKADVFIELSAVSYIDSSGVASLVEGLQMAQDKKKQFSLVNISSNVKMVLELSNLDKVFTIIEQLPE